MQLLGSVSGLRYIVRLARSPAGSRRSVTCESPCIKTRALHRAVSQTAPAMCPRPGAREKEGGSERERERDRIVKGEVEVTSDFVVAGLTYLLGVAA